MAKSTANNVVKSPHAGPVNHTEQELLEIIACVDSPLYFMENFMKVQHATKGSLAFTPYAFQRKIIKAFEENRFSTIMTSRQCGKSITSNTIITHNKSRIQIKNLFKLSMKSRVIEWLEGLLVKLSL